LLAMLAVRQYARNQAGEIINIDIVKEMRKRDGVYRIEEYEADTKNGALQTCKKDEDDCIQLKLVQRARITHDTYNFR
jgi:alanyl-tRNA synthetase